MAETLDFELVSPQRLLLSTPVEMVVVPGEDGDFGVLLGHAPMISALRTGVIAIYEDRNVARRIFVAGGFAEVTNERCTVLAEEAVALERADRDEAANRIKAAEENFRDADTDEERAQADSRLKIAQALLTAIDSPQTGH